ncbi:MAG: DUF4829 domain-containing protein [Clostridium sp.]|nr:DUF4829 domain-containing protein [Clostridium sp.]
MSQQSDMAKSHNMNKRFKILSCVLLGIFVVIGICLYCYYNKPERTIEKYINGMSNHNINEVSQCEAHSYGKLQESSLDYINYIDSLDIKAITDSNAIDDAYSHRVEVRPEYQDYPKKDIRLFDVSYYLKTIDEKATPIDSGTYTKSFLLIKVDNKWKIFSIEER